MCSKGHEEALSSTVASMVPFEVNAPARDFLDPVLTHKIQPEPKSVMFSSHPWSQATEILGPSTTGTSISSQNTRSTQISQFEANSLIPMMQQMIQSQKKSNSLLQSLVQAQLL